MGLAVALAVVAGGTDALGYVRLNGLFVSFMSGNTTQGAVELGSADAPHAALMALVIGLFVAGVVAGELMAGAGPRWSRPAALLLEAGLLGGAAAGLARAMPDLWAVILLALAIGVQNAALRRAGGIDVSLTYVTGTLVRLGRAVAEAALGRGALGAAGPYAALWLGFAAGACTGGLAARASAAGTLAVIAAAVLGLAAFCAVPAGAGRR